jgi:hypothetical protein
MQLQACTYCLCCLYLGYFLLLLAGAAGVPSPNPGAHQPDGHTAQEPRQGNQSFGVLLSTVQFTRKFCAWSVPRMRAFVSLWQPALVVSVSLPCCCQTAAPCCIPIN